MNAAIAASAEKQARDLFIENGWERVFLEARILTQAPLEEVAVRSGLRPAVVVAYMQRFYNVTQLLRFPSCVTNRLILTILGDGEEQVLERYLKQIDYFGGSLPLEANIACLERLLPPHCATLGRCCAICRSRGTGHPPHHGGGAGRA